MKPYSLDLRQRIIDCYTQAEGSIRQIAQRFKVSRDFVRRLLKRHRQTGSVEPKPHSGGKAPLLNDTHLEGLRTLVEDDIAVCRSVKHSSSNDRTNYEHPSKA